MWSSLNDGVSILELLFINCYNFFFIINGIYSLQVILYIVYGFCDFSICTTLTCIASNDFLYISYIICIVYTIFLYISHTTCIVSITFLYISYQHYCLQLLLSLYLNLVYIYINYLPTLVRSANNALFI